LAGGCEAGIRGRPVGVVVLHDGAHVQSAVGSDNIGPDSQGRADTDFDSIVVDRAGNHAISLRRGGRPVKAVVEIGGTRGNTRAGNRGGPSTGRGTEERGGAVVGWIALAGGGEGGVRGGPGGVVVLHAGTHVQGAGVGDRGGPGAIGEALKGLGAVVANGTGEVGELTRVGGGPANTTESHGGADREAGVCDIHRPDARGGAIANGGANKAWVTLAGGIREGGGVGPGGVLVMNLGAHIRGAVVDEAGGPGAIGVAEEVKVAGEAQRTRGLAHGVGSGNGPLVASERDCRANWGAGIGDRQTPGTAGGAKANGRADEEGVTFAVGSGESGGLVPRGVEVVLWGQKFSVRGFSMGLVHTPSTVQFLVGVPE